MNAGHAPRMAPSVASPARRDLILNCRGKCLGFTLIELLVTVAVIASLALLALTAITSITGQADESANRRNAQNMASVAATARAAGFTNHIATPEEWAEALNNGIIVTNALGHVLGEFRVGGLSEERVTAAIQYLVVTNTHLVYSSATD